MLATMTSKGQITLPKEIREQLKLDTGSKLDFLLQPDGTVTVRTLARSATSVAGLLKRSGRKPVTIEQMNTAVGKHLSEKHRPGVRKSSAVSKKK